MKRTGTTNVERRIVTSKVELRGEGEQKRLQGYAAVFNEETVIGGGWWGFREKIDPGAFTDAITADDVRALFNHDPNYVLGRNTSGTLTLTEDDHGLHYDIDPPATQVGRDVVTLVSRGDISQSSFAFIVPEDGDEWNYDEVKAGKLPLRTIRKVQLMDVSPVTYPAYPSTSVSARAKEMAAVGRPDRREDDDDGDTSSMPEATSAAFTAAHRAIEAAHAACRSLQEQVDISDAEDYGDTGSNNAAGAANADANSARRPTTTRTSGKPTMSNAGAHAVRACRRSLDAARHAMRCALRDAKHAPDAGDGTDAGDTGSGGDAGANAAALTDLQLRERELELDEVL